jgi:hypothetical protein
MTNPKTWELQGCCRGTYQRRKRIYPDDESESAKTIREMRGAR